MFGGDGDDQIIFNGQAENGLRFPSTVDLVFLGQGRLRSAFGGDGNDTITSANANGFFDGGEGNDRIAGSNFDDAIVGSEGDDFVTARGGDDNVAGGEGNDLLFAGDGNDRVLAPLTSLSALVQRNQSFPMTIP